MVDGMSSLVKVFSSFRVQSSSRPCAVDVRLYRVSKAHTIVL